MHSELLLLTRSPLVRLQLVLVVTLLECGVGPFIYDDHDPCHYGTGMSVAMYTINYPMDQYIEVAVGVTHQTRMQYPLILLSNTS